MTSRSCGSTPIPTSAPPASKYPRLPRDGRRRADRLRRPDILNLLPATISPDRVGLVGMHEWTEDDYPNIANWGIQSFSPDELRQSSQPVLDWLAGTGCSRVVLHFDVDTIDGNEIVLGLGHPAGGLTSAQVSRTVTRRRRRSRRRRTDHRRVLFPTGPAPAATSPGLPLIDR